MDWTNADKWQIDHILPLSSARNKKELLQLCNFQNLQPLWASDNLEKKDKILKLCKLY